MPQTSPPDGAFTFAGAVYPPQGVSPSSSPSRCAMLRPPSASASTEAGSGLADLVCGESGGAPLGTGRSLREDSVASEDVSPAGWWQARSPELPSTSQPLSSPCSPEDPNFTASWPSEASKLRPPLASAATAGPPRLPPTRTAVPGMGSLPLSHDEAWDFSGASARSFTPGATTPRSVTPTPRSAPGGTGGSAVTSPVREREPALRSPGSSTGGAEGGSFLDLCRQLAAAEHIATRRGDELQQKIHQEQAQLAKISALQQRLASETKRRELAEARAAALEAERDHFWERLADEESKTLQAEHRCAAFEREYDAGRHRLAAERVTRVRAEEELGVLLHRLTERDGRRESELKEHQAELEAAHVMANIYAKARIREHEQDMEEYHQAKAKDTHGNFEAKISMEQTRTRRAEARHQDLEDHFCRSLKAATSEVEACRADCNVFRGRFEVEESASSAAAKMVASLEHELATASASHREAMTESRRLHASLEDSEYHMLEHKIGPVLDAAHQELSHLEAERDAYHSHLTVEEFLYSQESGEAARLRRLLACAEKGEEFAMFRAIAEEGTALQHQLESSNAREEAVRHQHLLEVTESREAAAKQKAREAESRALQHRLEYNMVRGQQESLEPKQQHTQEQIVHYVATTQLELEASAAESMTLLQELMTCTERLASEEVLAAKLQRQLSSRGDEVPRATNLEQLSVSSWAAEKTMEARSLAVQEAEKAAEEKQVAEALRRELRQEILVAQQERALRENHAMNETAREQQGQHLEMAARHKADAELLEQKAQRAALRAARAAEEAKSVRMRTEAHEAKMSGLSSAMTSPVESPPGARFHWPVAGEADDRTR
eukprot:TRINITY_DN22851_c0_g1_i1.p1 TRINITY_DN22851_c0_g1~~TRINITY_DN22851_c0_g1_i1.p1  ORF type:complete len:843 (-),score=208.86 TRINITY_DN22851_c0_g1_i1:95-2623(-)